MYTLLDDADAAAARATLGAQASLGYTPVNKAGDSMTGDLSFTKDVPIVNLFSPNGLVGYKVIANVTNAVAGDYIIQTAGASTLWAMSNAGTVTQFGNLNQRKDVPTISMKSPNGVNGFDVLANVTNGVNDRWIVKNSAGTDTFTISQSGDLVATGGATFGGGRKLQKITLSSSAPGALTDGELYLQY